MVLKTGGDTGVTLQGQDHRPVMTIKAWLIAGMLMLVAAASPALAASGDPPPLLAAFRNVQRNAWSEVDIQTINRHAVAGNAAAVEVMAWMYATGRGLMPNPVNAFQWYIKAAELGVPRASHNARIVLAKVPPHLQPLFQLKLASVASMAPAAKSQPGGSEEVRRMVIAEAKRYQVPPALALAVAHVESRFDPTALSSAGARGVMQIMPATGLGEFGVHPDRLWEPSLNVQLGVAFLASLITQYGDVRQALAHYNGGGAAARSMPPDVANYVELVISWWRRFDDQPAGSAIAAPAVATARPAPAPTTVRPTPAGGGRARCAPEGDGRLWSCRGGGR